MLTSARASYVPIPYLPLPMLSVALPVIPVALPMLSLPCLAPAIFVAFNRMHLRHAAASLSACHPFFTHFTFQQSQRERSNNARDSLV